MWGVRFADFISFSLKYPMKMKEFGLTETKLFHFHRIFKTGGGEVGLSEHPESPLNQPLQFVEHFVSSDCNYNDRTVK